MSSENSNAENWRKMLSDRETKHRGRMKKWKEKKSKGLKRFCLEKCRKTKKAFTGNKTHPLIGEGHVATMRAIPP